MSIMEIFTSACFIVILYCTEWFGLRHCVAVPVPTLTNYYQRGNSQNSRDFEFRQMRNPQFLDNFIFPNKNYMRTMKARSGNINPESGGKIIFPDEVSTKNEKNGMFEMENRPVWKVQHRPTSEDSSSGGRIPVDYKSNFQSSEDGSNSGSVDSGQLTNQPLVEVNKRIDDITIPEEVLPGQGSLTSSTASDKQLSEEELVSVAAKEFYQWLRQRKNRTKSDCKDEQQQKQQFITSQSGSKVIDAKNPDHISEHSLVAGFRDQECPEGHVRVENGECKAKVDV